MMNTGRLAHVKRDGKRFFVQQIDLDKGKVYCWGELAGYRGKAIKFLKDQIILERDAVEVEDVSVTPGLLEDLFEQAKLSVETELLAGDLIVKEHPADRPGKAFASNPSKRHPSLRCLCCGQPMRLRKLRTGASFYGCGSWELTGCNARWTGRDGWNLNGTHLEGSDLQGTGKEDA